MLESEVMLAIAVLLTAVSSIVAVVISVRAMKEQRENNKANLEFTKASIEQQQEHNRKSVQPLCNIRLRAIKHETFIVLHNAGNGPMKIKKFGFGYSNKDEEAFESLREFMPNKKLPKGSIWIRHSDYRKRSLEANGTLEILKFTKEEDWDERWYQENRLWLLKSLGILKISIEYESLYGEITLHEEDLKLFSSVFERVSKIHTTVDSEEEYIFPST